MQKPQATQRENVCRWRQRKTASAASSSAQKPQRRKEKTSAASGSMLRHPGDAFVGLDEAVFDEGFGEW